MQAVQLQRVAGVAPPIAPDPVVNAATEAWNLMGGEIQWGALDTLAEMLGVNEPEPWIRTLIHIRDQLRATA